MEGSIWGNFIKTKNMDMVCIFGRMDDNIKGIFMRENNMGLDYIRIRIEKRRDYGKKEGG
jgi:hypothetical protein